MAAEIETTQTEVRDKTYETIPVFWWGSPDETQLTDFAEKGERVERPYRPTENDSEYVNLYFVS